MAIRADLDVLQGKKKLSEQFVSYANRCTTDILGFFGLIFILIIFGLGHLLDAENLKAYLAKKQNNSTYGNGSWQNDSLMSEATNEVIFNKTLLFDSIIHLLKTEELIRGVNFFQLGFFAKGMAFVYFLQIQTCLTVSNIFTQVLTETSFYMHFTIINITRIIVGLFVLVAINFPTAELWNPDIASVWSIEIYVVVWNVFSNIFGFCVNMIESIHGHEGFIVKIKNVYRFYIIRRYLILFRCIIVTAMVLLVKFVTINAIKNRPTVSTISWFTVIGSVFVVLYLHIYGKLVIMTTTASHDWNKIENSISFEEVLSAMKIIFRYHLGRICWDVYYFPMEISVISTIVDEKYNDSNIEVGIQKIVYTKAYDRELSRMFTAVLGQTVKETIKSTFYFKRKGRPPLTSKSITTRTWKVLLDCLLQALMLKIFMQKTAIEMPMLYSLVLVYLVTNCIVAYIVAGIDTIENTIQFCKIEEELDMRREENQENNASLL